MPDISSSNFTDRQLKFSYWYLTHKIVLRRWLLVFWGALAALMLFYVGWQLVFYTIEYNTLDFQTRRLLLEPNIFLNSSVGPQPFQIVAGGGESYGGDNGRYDFAAKVSNPNKYWLATFDYQMVSASGRTAVRSGFVLPGEEKYLLVLGVNSPDAQLEITNQKWQRFGDFEKKYNDRFRLEISNENFSAGKEAGDPNKVSFNVTNHSGFGFWEAGFQVFLTNGGNIVAANYLTIEKLKAGETRNVQLNWNTRLPRINGIQVVPEVNILDDNNIMKPE